MYKIITVAYVFKIALFSTTVVTKVYFYIFAGCVFKVDSTIKLFIFNILKVPLIIKVPGKAPAVCNSFSELLDLYPTLAELAGLKASKHLQGKSLVKTLDNPKTDIREYAFSVSQGGKSFLVRSHKWAYIQYDEDAGSGMELFDMEHDAKQYNNLAHNPAYGDVVQEMQKILKEKLLEIRTNDLAISYGSN